MRTAFAQSRGGLRGEHLACQPVDSRRLLAHARPWRSGPVRARHAARIGPLHFASSDIAGIGLMHVDGAHPLREAGGEVLLDLVSTC